MTKREKSSNNFINGRRNDEVSAGRTVVWRYCVTAARSENGGNSVYQQKGAVTATTTTDTRNDRVDSLQFLPESPLFATGSNAPYFWGFEWLVRPMCHTNIANPTPIPVAQFVIALPARHFAFGFVHVTHPIDTLLQKV